MSGDAAVMASSCPAYMAFRSDTSGLGALGSFGLPMGHRAGTPTVLESLGNMSVIDEESSGDGDGDAGWASSEDEGNGLEARGTPQGTPQGPSTNIMNMDEDDEHVFEFD